MHTTRFNFEASRFIPMLFCFLLVLPFFFSTVAAGTAQQTAVQSAGKTAAVLEGISLLCSQVHIAGVRVAAHFSLGALVYSLCRTTHWPTTAISQQ